MAYQSIRFYNFRNLEDQELALGGDIYYLVGENGAGKSSFLEALYLLSYGSSFREKNLENCLCSTEQPLAISGKIQQESQYYDLQIQYERSKNSRNSGAGKKSIMLNSKKLQDRKELLQITPSIVFAHGDIAFITGSPKEKRQFIDQTISLIDPYYIDLTRSYTRNLAQRNWVLKNKQLALLPTYTLQMVKIGLEIQQRRSRHIHHLSQIFSSLFQHVSNFPLPVFIKYQASWQHVDFSQNSSKTVQNCLEFMEQRQEYDVLLGSSQNGPHRDQILFTAKATKIEKEQSIETKQNINQQNFTKIASTGQLRLAALALRNAQANYLQKSTNSPSVLLLDDVLLEMDSTRRKLFLASLPPYQQVFFTLLPNEDYRSYPFTDYQVLQIQDGNVSL